jgi:hypothetical protein
MKTWQFVAALTFVAACGDDDPAGTPDGAPVEMIDAAAAIDAPDDQVIPEPAAPWFGCDDSLLANAQVVTVHDKAPQYFSGWENGQNQRIVDKTAELPAGPWARVYLRLDLECPGGNKCDWWDRGASVSLVDPAAADKPIELARYMTPYRTGMCFVADVTEFQSRLVGTKALRAFIDTWVGPGHPNGDGWLVTTKLIYHAGDAAKTTEVIPLWNNQAEDKLVDIDPSKPLDAQVVPTEVTIPADATKVELRYIVTGHGQGNLNNCAEFCELAYTTHFGDQEAKLIPWRSNCAQNPVSDQAGTWMYNRAGWCPGAFVAPTLLDITSQVTPGEKYTFSFSITDSLGSLYNNTCAPGQGGTGNVCSGCAFDQNVGNCEFNNGSHTPPYARLSIQLVVTK